MKEIIEGLKNFPKREEDTFERLRVIVKNRTENFTNLKENEKIRLEQELSIVKEMGISCIILFFYDIKEELKDVDAVCHGVMHCSYLYYILGLTRVNPFDYNLPFERYFGKNKKNLSLVGNPMAKGSIEELSNYTELWDYTVTDIEIKGFGRKKLIIQIN